MCCRNLRSLRFQDNKREVYMHAVTLAHKQHAFPDQHLSNNCAHVETCASPLHVFGPRNSTALTPEASMDSKLFAGPPTGRRDNEAWPHSQVGLVHRPAS